MANLVGCKKPRLRLDFGLLAEAKARTRTRAKESAKERQREPILANKRPPVEREALIWCLGKFSPLEFESKSEFSN